MLKHIRANLWLLVVTLGLCSGLYPFVLWWVGQTFFHDRAAGSIVYDKAGKPIGSRLIAQPFTADEYFQPRPSAASYNASASGASNWSASNPLLRDRVARQLGPIVKYRSGPKKGEPVGGDVETWFREQKPDYVAHWAEDHSALAEQWIKDHADAVGHWLGKEADAVKDDAGAAAKEFFPSFGKRHPGNWPGVSEVKGPDGKIDHAIAPIRDGGDVQAYLFDPWLQAHPDVDLEPVPGDMVTASGSGLDPHITLKNALYQLDRVAIAWAKKTGKDKAAVGREITNLLHKKAEAPLGGLVGVDLINVLEINVVLVDLFGTQGKQTGN